jgi:hypothetical protein
VTKEDEGTKRKRTTTVFKTRTNETLKIQKGHFLFPFEHRLCHKEDATKVVVVVVVVVIYSPLSGSIVVVVLLFLGRRFIHSGMGC